MAYHISLSKLLTFIAVAAIAGFSLYISLQRQKAKSLKAAQAVYNVLDRYRIPYDIDKRSIDPKADTTPQPAQGVDECIQNLDHFTSKKLPISMLLVGFPFKSNNLEKKVITRLPDMAERKSLEYLQEILNQIKAVYSPGAIILIFCDGIYFGSFFGINDETVFAYEKALKQLASDLPDIKVLTSEDMLKEDNVSPTSQMLNLIDQYEPSDEKFKAEVKVLPETALKRFALELDHPAGAALLKKTTLEDLATKLLAREMRLRAYIAKKYPSTKFFRLTVHFTPDISKKFGIRLSPTSVVTPYHGVLVQDTDGAWSIIFKKGIDLKKYKLHMSSVNGIDLPGYQADALHP